MAGCKKDESKTAPGSIYGTVTDKATGECVSAAGVELMPKGLKTVTGSDGTFQFTEIDPGEYNLFITKSGYQDLKSSTITVKSGEQAKGDVQIEKLPASLQIMDNDGQIISELNFGGDPGIISKTFKIINRGTTTLNFRINKYIDWIESITPNEGTIPVNRDCPIILKIDREKLADGSNTTSIIITSEDGGVELIVKAKKGAYSDDVFELPAAHLMVQLDDLGCVNWSSAKTLCESSTVAGYNDWRLPTREELMTLYNNREEIGGFTTGTYWSSTYVSGGYYNGINFNNGDLDYYSSSNKFNVRAVRTMTQENGVMELPTANLMVQTQDLGCVNWNSANTLCESSTIAGYNDWRLPTIEELGTLYNNRALIGGFTTGRYWSSSYIPGWSSPYVIDFSNGNNGECSSSTNLYVRAVRTSTGGSSVTSPTVSTSTPSNVTTNSATCGGNVTSDGGATVTARGVCWSTSSNPSVNGNHLQASTGGTGSFTCIITGLSENTTYYVKAYATNSQGTAYGNLVPFTTTGGGSSATTPTVITTQPSNPTNNSVTCGGNVTSDGGATITERGVCWSTSSNPSIYGDHLPASTNGTGSFTCNITGLSENTTYYVKAYATNSEGIAYGARESFKTDSGGGQSYSFTFESGPENWHQIDADGDGYTWWRCEATEVGHNDSNACVTSESYVNDSKGALKPDNYLYSPQRFAISNGASISFYVCAQDASWAAEHYGVAVATTSSSPTASDFITIWEETLTAKFESKNKVRGTNEQGEWYLKTINLSTYAGQSIWIAIRHFNCTDMFRINIDDITIVTGN